MEKWIGRQKTLNWSEVMDVGFCFWLE